MGAALTTTASQSAQVLKWTGAAAALTIGNNFTFATNGILNAGTGAMTVATGTGTSALTGPAGGGNLILNTGSNQGITVSGVIADNAGATRVVVTGPATTTLTGTSTFTGGIDLNSGTLSYNAVAGPGPLGAAANSLTFQRFPPC